MSTTKDITIIGGGLAGLTTAIHLSKAGFKVVLIEKNEYPKHKVCGEYISNEVLPYFEKLGCSVLELNPSKISKIEFSTSKSKLISGTLPLGGFGISRYSLDYYLYKKALENGCQIINDNAINVSFAENEFHTITLNGLKITSKFAIGAFGKRSNLDLSINRNFIKQKSPWLAVKAHYSGNFPVDVVGLHNFKGGYCGVSKIEKNTINICYLVDYDSFKTFKNIEEFQENVICQNTYLKSIFEKSKLLFEKPLTISQISFAKKEVVENHILMIGDSAGLIHPLCGNGMALSIHSAKIVSELIIDYYHNKISNREELEKKYIKLWNKNFSSRLSIGRILSKILRNDLLTSILMKILVIFPFILPIIIKKTHGKPII